MPLRKPILASRDKAFAPSLLLIDAARPLEELLASGGDGRLALKEQRNAYGCTPFPRPALLDFGSSTASSISQRAYARVEAAQAQFWLDAARIGTEDAFDSCVEAARNQLLAHLGAQGAEVVFAPSGTDAQLQVLFLVKALLGTPLTTIIVGADQTGSGTAFTARGQHFSDRTALGVTVEKGAPILSLSEKVRTVGIPFCNEAGRLRSDDEMDAAVNRAVTDAVRRGEKVLLQVMDSSKLGWRGPSAGCIHAIAAAWPDHMRVVVDACQMRIGRPLLRDYLARGYFVLMTGSKFFTGPAFSGALLVPAAQAKAVDAISALPQGLCSYTTQFDWPLRWTALRGTLLAGPNFGQWLRWEATLEEMNAYFAVPPAFRDGLLRRFAAKVPVLIAASPNLDLLAERGSGVAAEQAEEMQHRTIFSFVPQHDGKPLSLERCTSLYRTMGHDLSELLPKDDAARKVAALVCQIGQPVVMRHRAGAVLRLCASARLVTDCWDRGAATADAAMAPVLADISAVIQKLDWLIAHPEICDRP